MATDSVQQVIAISPEIKVRRAKLADAALVARIVRASFQQYRRGSKRPQSARLSAARVREDMLTGRKRYAVASIDGKKAGIIAYKRYGKRMLFGPVAVLPTLRQRGVGRALLHWLERRAKADGCREVIGLLLWGLPSLQQYYRNKGYRILRTRQGWTFASKVLY